MWVVLAQGWPDSGKCGHTVPISVRFLRLPWGLSVVFPLHWLNLLRGRWEKPQPERVLVYPENTCRSITLGSGVQETILV